MWDAQRYTVSVTYEQVPRDGSPSSGAKTRTVTMWASTPEMAKERVEHWAKREFHRQGFTVIAHANDAQLAH